MVQALRLPKLEARLTWVAAPVLPATSRLVFPAQLDNRRLTSRLQLHPRSRLARRLQQMSQTSIRVGRSVHLRQAGPVQMGSS